MKIITGILSGLLMLPLAAQADNADSHDKSVAALIKVSGLSGLYHYSVMIGLGKAMHGNADLQKCLDDSLSDDQSASILTPGFVAYLSDSDTSRLITFFGTDQGQKLARAFASYDMPAISAETNALKPVMAQDQTLGLAFANLMRAMQPSFGAPGTKHAIAAWMVHSMLYSCREQAEPMLLMLAEHSMPGGDGSSVETVAPVDQGPLPGGRMPE